MGQSNTYIRIDGQAYPSYHIRFPKEENRYEGWLQALIDYIREALSYDCLGDAGSTWYSYEQQYLGRNQYAAVILMENATEWAVTVGCVPASSVNPDLWSEEGAKGCIENWQAEANVIMRHIGERYELIPYGGPYTSGAPITDPASYPFYPTANDPGIVEPTESA